MKKKYRIKLVNDSVYYKKNGIFILGIECKSSRKNSWISLRQITKEYPEFFDKIDDIFTQTNPTYYYRAKNFAYSICEFLELFGFLSWKQFDSIWGISSTYNDYISGKERGYYRYGSVVSISKNRVHFTSNIKYVDTIIFPDVKNMTDQQMDLLHKQITGERVYYPEEYDEGLVLSYDKDGGRFFSLPTDEDCDNAWNEANTNNNGLY